MGRRTERAARPIDDAFWKALEECQRECLIYGFVLCDEDAQAGEELFKEEDKYSLSYTQHSPTGIPGVTNYYLPLYSQKEDCDGTPIAILWFFDSQRRVRRFP